MKLAASDKGRGVDEGDAIGESDAGQTFAKGKRTLADGGDAVRDGDAGQTVAVVKRAIANGCDGMAVQLGGDFQIFSRPRITSDFRGAVLQQYVFIIAA